MKKGNKAMVTSSAANKRGASRRKGFTLVEFMVVVAVIAVICAIAIPSIIAIRNSLNAKQRDNYAKSIYLAAQTNLTILRSQGKLPEITELSETGAVLVPGASEAGYSPAATNDYFPFNPQGYYYITSADAAAYAAGNAAGSSHDTAELYDRLVPLGSVEDFVRYKNVLMEYNPTTGSIHAVYYSEEGDEFGYSALADSDNSGSNLRNDAKVRKTRHIGYYSGEGDENWKLLGIDEAPDTLNIVPEVSFDNDTGEIKVTLEVNPMFVPNLVGHLGIEGELSGRSLPKINLNTDPRAKQATTTSSITYTYTLDSLDESKNFSTLNKDAEGKPILEFGENVMVSVDFEYDESAESTDIITIESPFPKTINPLYASLKIVTGGHSIEIANVRNLQNLRLYNASETINFIDFISDIDFSKSDAWPADRQFEPLSNKTLFGEGTFYTLPNGDEEQYWIEEVLPIHPARDISENKVVFTDVEDVEKHPVIRGNGHEISNISISGSGAVGLFSYLNAKVEGLTISDATVMGSVSAANGSVPAYTSAGILAGFVGYQTEVVDCTIADSSLTVTGGDICYAGGLVGYAAESKLGHFPESEKEYSTPGVDVVRLALTVRNSTETTCAGGMAGTFVGSQETESDIISGSTGASASVIPCSGFLGNSTVTGTISCNDGKAGFVGGAVGMEVGGASYKNVEADVKLNGWGTADLETLIENDPHGFGINVGKFIGHVDGGMFKDCTALERSNSYKFLGTIDCETISDVSLGTLGNFYRLNGGYYTGEEIDIENFDVFRNSGYAVPCGNVVELYEYAAVLDNCLFDDQTGSTYYQEISEFGYCRETTTMRRPVTYDTLEKGRSYYLISYDGQKIMCATNRVNPNVPGYYTINGEKDENGDLHMDSALLESSNIDLEDCVWEFCLNTSSSDLDPMKAMLYSPSRGYLFFHSALSLWRTDEIYFKDTQAASRNTTGVYVAWTPIVRTDETNHNYFYLAGLYTVDNIHSLSALDSSITGSSFLGFGPSGRMTCTSDAAISSTGWISQFLFGLHSNMSAPAGDQYKFLIYEADSSSSGTLSDAFVSSSIKPIMSSSLIGCRLSQQNGG